MMEQMKASGQMPDGLGEDEEAGLGDEEEGDEPAVEKGKGKAEDLVSFAAVA